MDRHLKETITGFVSLVIFLLFFVFSFSIEIKTVGGGVSSRTIPQIISVLGIILSIALTLKNFIPYLKKRREKNNSDVYVERKRWKQVGISTGLMLCYIALMNTFGFILTSIVYLFLQMLVIQEKPTKKRVLLLAVIAICVPLILYVPFRYGFQLMIPVGTVFR